MDRFLPQQNDDSGRWRRRRVLAAGAMLPLVPAVARAASMDLVGEDSLVVDLFRSLSTDQKQSICFPYQAADRSKLNANWHVTKIKIGDAFYSAAQRELVERIVGEVMSPEGLERLKQQMEEDDGGLGAYSIGLFGDPITGPFQWLLTGRHVTLRADGASDPKVALGGGIVYGHGEESKPQNNLYFDQTQKVQTLFEALTSSQREQALLASIPEESKLQLQGPQGRFDGLEVAAMSDPQKDQVRETLSYLLKPFRESDAREILSKIDAGGGIDRLRFAFYRDGDLDGDQVWDDWRIEGPNAIFHFRGAPHVHAFIHVADVS